MEKKKHLVVRVEENSYRKFKAIVYEKGITVQAAIQEFINKSIKEKK